MMCAPPPKPLARYLCAGPSSKGPVVTDNGNLILDWKFPASPVRPIRALFIFHLLPQLFLFLYILFYYYFVLFCKYLPLQTKDQDWVSMAPRLSLIPGKLVLLQSHAQA